MPSRVTTFGRIDADSFPVPDTHETGEVSAAAGYARGATAQVRQVGGHRVARRRIAAGRTGGWPYQERAVSRIVPGGRLRKCWDRHISLVSR
ncbi:hypothetical protein HOK021_41390 [Streptomyces hygroscopicus]|nr:hypothetical protein HOK021_41390 [Streptomyces hygroscopicus]